MMNVIYARKRATIIPISSSIVFSVRRMRPIFSAVSCTGMFHACGIADKRFTMPKMPQPITSGNRSIFFPEYPSI